MQIDNTPKPVNLQVLGPRIEEKFWSKVLKTPSCWLWKGCLVRGGYGGLSIGKPQRPYRAHRISWVIHYGPVPDGLFVLHHCDIRNCVRPDHLFLGTKRDNTLDMMRKGRGVFGARPGNHNAQKLDGSQVKEIGVLYSTGLYSQDRLGIMFGISQSTISKIILKQLAYCQH